MIGFGTARVAPTTLVPGQTDMPKAGTIGFTSAYPNVTVIVTEEES